MAPPAVPACPRAGAYDSLLRLRGDCDLMVVTSRQHVIQEPTLEWLEEHFPQVIRACWRTLSWCTLSWRTLSWRTLSWR